jgi:hypothetical protein
MPFYVSKVGKNYAQANFEGDQSLVPEGRIFEVLALNVHVEQATPRVFIDVNAIFAGGYFEWKIGQTTTDRDWLYRLIGGVDLYDTAGAQTPFQGDGAHANIRKYAISRFVPGGRSIEFRLAWPVVGGVILTKSAIVKVSLYGFEEIPREVSAA